MVMSTQTISNPSKPYPTQTARSRSTLARSFAEQGRDEAGGNQRNAQSPVNSSEEEE